MDQKIIADVFLRHLESLTNRLNENEGLCILSGKEQGSTKPKTKAMFIWLFGYDMIETIFIATKKTIIYLASNKKLQMMDEIKSKLPSKYEIHFLQKQAENKDNFNKIKQILGDNILLTPIHDKQAGPLSQEWDEFGQFTIKDSSLLIAELLAVKEEQEQGFVKQSALLTTKLIKKLISMIESTIDVGNKIKHFELAKKIEGLLENNNEKQKLMKDLNLQDGLYDLAYTPIIQSGGNYSLLPNAQPNRDNLSSDVIILSLGTQVNEYNTNCVRTLFINPTELQKKIYNVIFEVQNKLIITITAGLQLGQLYKDCANFFITKLKEIGVEDPIPKNFGFGIGLELREVQLSIQQDNEHIAQVGEVYFIQISMENLAKGQKGISYAVSLGDVLIVTTTQPIVITNQVPKAYKGISYQLQEDDDEEEQEEPKRKEETQKGSARTRGPRNQQIQIQRENEKQRQKHQEELAKSKQVELEERLEKDQFVQNFTENKALELDNIQCYQGVDKYPREVQKGQIYVDNQKSTILVPYQNGHIPFHVSCIKNVSKIDEGRIGQSIRINFFTTETSAGQIQFPQIEGQTIFIKELQYRSKKTDRPQNLINQIKSLQKKVKAEQQVEKEKLHVGDMEPLILNKGGRKPIFRDLKVRPTFGQGKGSGILEVHTNGFRYIHNSKEVLDIVYKNIKHYIYQSPEKEIIAAIHFHLHSPIVLGRKKTHDVQFYCEVGGGVEHLEGRKKTHKNDDDEIEEEERLRQQRRKMAKEFEAFIKSIEEVAVEYKIEFEKPLRKLGFEGNWNRARIFLQPTGNTLMNIVESPFFILTVNEVEICCFERIIPGIKSFDLVFVFKNYERPVLRVESIDMKDLEEVKNWLDRMNLLFFEVGQNLVWKNVLGQIQKDIPGFVMDGGWTNILAESEDEGEGIDEIEAGDSEFSPEGSLDDDDDSDFSDEDDEGDDGGHDDDDDDDDEDGGDDEENEEDISDVIDLNKISDEEESDEESDQGKKHRKMAPPPQKQTKQVNRSKPNPQNNHNNNNKRAPQKR